MKIVLVAAFFVVFPLFFAALWILVCFVVSLGGWRTLALHFGTESKPQGHSFSMQSLELGNSHYNGCMSLIVAEKGLYLRPWIIFRAFHPPLLVPWNAFEMPQFRRVWWVNQCVIQVRTPEKPIEMIFAALVGQQMAALIEAAKTAPDALPAASPWSTDNTAF